MNRGKGLVSGAVIATTTFVLAGCASMPAEPGFDQVQDAVQQRSDYIVQWHQDSDADERAERQVRDLLEQDLTADSAVQIALLNNRELQATYQQLGVAQADLVQAGLLSNPVFSGELLFPVDGGPVELELGVAQSFLEVFTIPLRKRVAESRFEEARLTITGAVFDLAYETRTAFYAAQAHHQRVEMFEQIVTATELSYDFAQRLYDAGNITALELQQQRDLYEQTRLQLRRAEAEREQARERLNRLMGVFGEDTQWQIVDRLPDVPEQGPDINEIETEAIQASFDLAVAAQRITTAGHRLGIDESTALVPELEAGVQAERNSDWSIGPTLALPIPLFDQGQARLARSRFELRQQQERYTALAVQIRSIAREARDQLHAAEDIARHYQQVILPLRERITNETQLQYNAMQVGPIELLRARERQIEAGREYIDALQAYWTARATIDQLQRGRTPHEQNMQAMQSNFN